MPKLWWIYPRRKGKITKSKDKGIMKSLTPKEQNLAIDMLRYLAAVAFGRETPYTKEQIIKIIKNKT